MNKDNWGVWLQLVILTMIAGGIYDRLGDIIKLMEVAQ